MKTKSPATAGVLIGRLRSLADPKIAAGMARFGICGEKILGISVPVLRDIARKNGRNHRAALALWRSGIHEARILAAFVEEPESITRTQMEKWARDFRSWDVCDQICGNLFDRTPWAEEKAMVWSERKEEFVKRAGFVLMAYLAVHDKTAPDEMFQRFLPVIEREACDERNFVRKAVNWALRQIGKRNAGLKKEAIRTAERILKQKMKSAHWIARDALRELKKHKNPVRP